MAAFTIFAAMEFLDKIAALARPHSLSIAVAIVATTLAVFGGAINNVLRLATKKMNVAVRFGFYIFVYAFGVGIFSSQVVRFLRKFLQTLPSGYFLLFVIGIFLFLCFVAKKEKQI